MKDHRDYYQQLYANEMDNLEEINKLLEKYNLSKLNQGEIENLNQKSSNKQKPRTRRIHSWILPKI